MNKRQKLCENDTLDTIENISIDGSNQTIKATSFRCEGIN